MKPEGWPDDPASHLDWLLDRKDEERLALLDELGMAQREEFSTHWRLWARRDQLPPEGDWRCWLVMAGRGFGKTRAGSEWVRSVAEADPEARIALIGASLGEARAVMVEGESGLLAISPPPRAPVFEPSLKRLTWPNGAQAMLYSAQEPESLRGPQHSHARRPGAEGGLRQRSPLAGRWPPALRRRGGSEHAASSPARRAGLACRRQPHRSLERQGGASGTAPGRQLALRASSRWHAGARPFNRPGPSLPWRVARPGRSRSPDWWDNHRCRGAHRDRWNHRLPARSGAPAAVVILDSVPLSATKAPKLRLSCNTRNFWALARFGHSR